MFLFIIYILTSYLLVQFFFSIGYALLTMFKETDVDERANIMLRHIGVATFAGAVALYLLFYLLRNGL